MIRLFCLPYAGASETVFYEWKNYIHPMIKLCPIELKGRGRRIREPLYNKIDEAVEDILFNIKEEIENYDYAIYGHSMGSLLAYELYYKIVDMELRKPNHIFFSGYGAPNTKQDKLNKFSTLSDWEFISKISEYGGMSKKVLENKELIKLILPILRGDCKIIEQYKYREREEKINCNITIFNGKEDTIDMDDLLAWNQHTSKGFKILNFKGNHFFINNKVKEIVDIIYNELLLNTSVPKLQTLIEKNLLCHID